MPFPKKYAEFVARTRVTAGFLVLAAFLWFSRPTAESLVLGGLIGAFGIAIRAWAAGHLAKNQRLASSGPYAHVRNPLYVGTLLAGVGLAFAGAEPLIGVALVGFFVLYYLPVVEEEERHLAKILPGYEGYRAQVPRLWPSLTPRTLNKESFNFRLYLKNQEYQALLGYLAALGALAAKLTLT